jgi:hypothetical protein
MKSSTIESTNMNLNKTEIDKIMGTMKRTVHFALGTTLALGCLTLPGVAQDQASQTSQPAPIESTGAPLGDYARKVHKEDAGKSKPKVFDNDNLPREDKLSIVGPASPENTDATAEASPAEPGNQATSEAKPAEAGAATQPATEAKDIAKSPAEEQKVKEAAWKQWQEKLSAQKDQIGLLTRELDVLQREYQIRAAAMYADVGNRLRNSGAWDKQDADYKQQIADKQKAVDDAKQKLEDMNEEARKAGVPSSMREP